MVGVRGDHRECDISWAAPRRGALPQKSRLRAAARPSDVRKRSALPSVLQNSRATPEKWAQPGIFKRTSRKARGLPHIRRQSRCLRTTFEAKHRRGARSFVVKIFYIDR